MLNADDVSLELIRKTRVSGTLVGHPKRDPFWTSIGYKYAGPIAYSFTRWLLNKAAEDGIQRLFFTSRDCFIPYLIYRHVIARVQSGPASAYAYMSRRAAIYANLDDFSYSDARKLFDNHFGITPAQCLARLGIEPQSFPNICKAAGFGDPNLIKHDTLQLQKLIKPALPHILKNIHSERAALVRYMIKIGLTEPHSAFVDLGRGGTVLMGMHRALLNEGCCNRPIGYFWAVDERGSLMEQANLFYRSQVMDRGRPRKTEELIDEGIEILELLLTAPHGMLLHFDDSVQKPRPVLRHGSFEDLKRNDIVRSIAAGALRFSKDLVAQAGSAGLPELSSEFVLSRLNQIVRHPSLIEAQRIGAVHHEQGEGDSLPLVQPLAPEFMGDLRVIKKTLDSSYWEAGALRQLPGFQRSIAQAYFLAGRPILKMLATIKKLARSERFTPFLRTLGIILFQKTADSKQVHLATEIATDLEKLPKSPHENLALAIYNPAVHLVSFDIFDTLLTRTVAEPVDIFLFVGKELNASGITDISPESFARRRASAENLARRNSPEKEITIESIYDEMMLDAGPNALAKSMMQTELDAEDSSIRPIPHMRELVDVARKKHGGVVFISDMYLPEQLLKRKLEEFGFYKPGDRLYISSTCGHQKYTGKLFRFVLEAEGIEPKHLLHCGNSIDGDVAPARRLGIRTHYFQEGNLNASEQTLPVHTFHTAGSSSLLGGAARLTRLKCSAGSEGEKTIWQTGASVAGPIFYIYAQWLLENAQKNGVKQICFLARDAYLLYLVTREIAAHRGLDEMDLVYLYGSRATYLPLDAAQVGASELSMLASHCGERYETIESLRQALAVTSDTFDRHLQKLGYSKVDWTNPITNSEVEKIRAIILTDREFNADIAADLKRFHSLTRDYFSQAGLKLDQKTAFVDTGWTTRSHAPLIRFLKREGFLEPKLFLIGAIYPYLHVPAESLHTFLFNFGQSRGAPMANFYYPRIFETLCLSDHGRTIGFARKNGQVRVKRLEHENKEFVKQYFDQYRDAILAFTETMSHVEADAFVNSDLRHAMNGLAARFWNRPSVEEAKVWSKLSWEWDPHGQRKYQLAHPFRLRDSWAALLRGRYPSLHEQFWSGAAMQLTPRWKRQVIKAAVKCHNIIINKLGRFPKRMAVKLRAIKFRQR